MTNNDDTDFYAVLNLQKNASEQDIKVSYRKFVNLFHPDKHSIESKELAQERFQIIQKAYETLSDPAKRWIYDAHGAKGLEKSWIVDLDGNSKREMLKGYERMVNLQNLIDEQKSVQSVGKVQVQIDATRLFNPIRKRPSVGLMALWEEDGPLDIDHMLVLHSWKTNITQHSSLGLHGTLFTKNGMGNGNITLEGATTLTNSMSADASVALGDYPNLKLGLKHFIGSSSVFTFTNTFSSLIVLPKSSLTISRHFSAEMAGFVNYVPDWANIWGVGGRSICSIGLTHSKGDGSTTVIEVQASKRTSKLILHQISSLQGGLYKVKAATSISPTEGMALSIGGDRKLNQTIRAGMGVDFSQTRGVVFNLKFDRLGQKVRVPILMSAEADFMLAFGALVIPLAGYLAIDRLILKKYREQKRIEDLVQLRKDNAEMLNQRRKEALGAMVLLTESIKKRLEAETKTEGGGLVILNAAYGKLPPSSFESCRLLSPDGINDLVTKIKARFELFLNREDSVQDVEYIDVTIPVQALVSNGQLHIGEGYPKSQIVGFYDPCFGEDKELRVTYQFQGKVHQVTVQDVQALDAPMRSHLIK